VDSKKVSRSTKARGGGKKGGKEKRSSSPAPGKGGKGPRGTRRRGGKEEKKKGETPSFTRKKMTSLISREKLTFLFYQKEGRKGEGKPPPLFLGTRRNVLKISLPKLSLGEEKKEKGRRPYLYRVKFQVLNSKKTYTLLVLNYGVEKEGGEEGLKSLLRLGEHLLRTRRIFSYWEEGGGGGKGGGRNCLLL